MKDNNIMVHVLRNDEMKLVHHYYKQLVQRHITYNLCNVMETVPVLIVAWLMTN